MTRFFHDWATITSESAADRERDAWLAQVVVSVQRRAVQTIAHWHRCVVLRKQKVKARRLCVASLLGKGCKAFKAFSEQAAWTRGEAATRALGAAWSVLNEKFLEWGLHVSLSAALNGMRLTKLQKTRLKYIQRFALGRWSQALATFSIASSGADRMASERRQRLVHAALHSWRTLRSSMRHIVSCRLAGCFACWAARLHRSKFMLNQQQRQGRKLTQRVFIEFVGLCERSRGNMRFADALFNKQRRASLRHIFRHWIVRQEHFTMAQEMSIRRSQRCLVTALLSWNEVLKQGKRLARLQEFARRRAEWIELR